MAEKYIITAEMLKKILRGEEQPYSIYSDIRKGMDVVIEDYHPVWDDIEALLAFLEKMNPRMSDIEYQSEFLTSDTYYDEEEEEPIDITDHYIWDLAGEHDISDRMDWTGASSPGNGMFMIADAIVEAVNDETVYLHAVSDSVIDIKRIREDIEKMKRGEWEPAIMGWKWTLPAKYEALRRPEGRGFGGPLIREDEIPEANEILDELCAKDDVNALVIKGYACYGDHFLMPCDWVKSRDIFLHLLELKTVNDWGKANFANTLGYIYYYGRCTDGVPDYDEAQKYFAMGAAGGVEESIYKLADMMRTGKGMPKDLTTAEMLVRRVYDKTLGEAYGGDRVTDYSDCALRLASIIAERGNHKKALEVLLQGKYSLRERMSEGNYYGDEQVMMSIGRAIAEQRKFVPETKFNDIGDFDPFAPLTDMLKFFKPLLCEVQGDDEDGSTHLVIYDEKDRSHRVFFTIPEVGYCTLTESIQYTFKEVDKLKIKKEQENFLFDSFKVETEPETQRIKIRFLMKGEKAASIKGTGFSVVFDDNGFEEDAEEGNDTFHTITACSFSEGGRTYDYIADDVDVEAGDRVVVPTSRGETVVTVVSVDEIAERDLPLAPSRYKKVLRKE